MSWTPLAQRTYILQNTSRLHPNAHYRNQRACMRSSLLVIPLLLGGICSPGARASADETLSLTIETQAPNQPVTVAGLTSIALASSPDPALPDDPALEVQQQAQEGSAHPEANATPQTDPLAQG